MKVGSPLAWSWKREAPQIALVVAVIAASAIAWPFVEEPVPMHWNARGEVDGWGSRWEALGIMPAVTVGIYLLLAFIPRLDPGRANYDSMAGAYTVIRLSAVALMAVIQCALIAAALGWGSIVGWIIPLSVGAMFVVLGNILGKLRPNYFAGIRTPWTLASVRSWDATHRLGGRVFMVMGVALMLMAVVQEAWFIIASLVAGGIALGWVVVYSYLVWKCDADPVSVTGTRPSEE
jgi:uncharacterized membrane protein